MAIREKLTDEDLMLYEIVRHPALCREFLENLDNEDVWDEEKDAEWWEHTRYQNEFICDFNNYVSICCGRSVGKTVALVSIILWILINDVFDGEYICYTVPNKVHLDPVWLGLTRMLRINTLLQQYLSPRGGINSSDHTVKLLNEAALDCRIAGTSGTGANVVGMHTPFEIVDEAGFYPWGTWIELQPTLNTWEKGHRRIVSGVPTGVREKNVLYYADQLDEEYTKHRISAHDNPRYTEKDEKDNLIKYGGEDSDDYLHHVLGEHGAPTFAVFDRTLMEIKTYPVFKLKLNGIQLTNEELFTRISTIPPVEETHNYKIMGIDLGYTDPTSIIILLVKNTGIYFYARIELQKVKYPTQKKLIDFLDERMKRIEVIGIDAGSPGVPVIHDLMEGDAYVHKDYAKRLVPVDFGGQVILGIDSEGEEIKSKLKPFAVSLTQEYSNSHRLIYSSTDTELITELERMTYVRNDRGDIRYKTLTPMGGQRGEDHHTAALLAGIVANYQMMDAELYKKKTTRLASTSWRG